MSTDEAPTIMTIGYEDRTADELVAELVRAAVTLLVDVRMTPQSRKPGMSKRRLADALAAVGIDYLHLPALGNPRDNRAALRRGEPDSQARFKAVLRTADARRALDELRRLVQAQRVALLCLEREAEHCHRRLISDELLRSGAAGTVVDL